ncbi:MAG: levansucrase [Pseudomonadota bacterium]
MVLALSDHWIWDSWYLRDGDTWHAYFLKAPKALGDPELRHFNVAQGHATSPDLRHWTHHGTCFAPADGPAWDDYTTWTGSTVRDAAGGWHLFYTGACRAEDGLYQRIGHAVSDDGHHWQRVGAGPCLDLTGQAAALYECDHATGLWHDRAMRDPWVMRDPGGAGWLMYFTARASGIAEPNAGGAIGLATSPDLAQWTLQPPVFVGGYGQLEVPQVFFHRGRWYCLFCTAAGHFSAAQAEATPGGPVTGSHYLMAEDPRGPWRIAPGGFLDGANPCARYAARIVDDGGHLRILGFADRPDDSFHGHVTDPDPVQVAPDGTLHVHTPATVKE